MKTYIVGITASALRDFRVRADSLDEAKQIAWDRAVRSFSAVKSWTLNFEGDEQDHIIVVTDTSGNVVSERDESSE